MTVWFYLKSGNKQNERVILAELAFDGNRVRKTTAVKGRETNWDKVRQIFRKSDPDWEAKNRIIETVKQSITTIYYRWKSDKGNLDDLKMLIRGNKKKKQKALSLFEWYDKYLATKTNVCTAGTMQVFRTCYKSLREFETRSGQKLTFQSFDAQFVDDYKAYLINVENLLDNTIYKRITNLKAFLNWCDERGVTDINPRYRKYTAKKRDGQRTHLTREELAAFDAVEGIKPGSQEELSKDLFSFSCRTGFRYSDLITLKKSDLQYDSLGTLKIRLLMEKTDDPVTIFIPKHQELPHKIIAKYDGKRGDFTFPMISNGVYNRALKEIAKKAGLDKSISTKRFQGGKSTETVSQQFEKITTHTARHTFAILSLLENKLPITVVQKLMGHRTIRTTQIYLNLTNQDLHEALIGIKGF